jgi:glycosyltransferase involved in cell wall biosynthesis
MKKTICLSMIVKNESECIQHSLELIKPYIDYWIISDTGSTDNTEEIVKKTLEGVPGKFHHHKWEDFATNRNIALNLAKNKADYTLIVDADDGLIVEYPSAFNNLTADVYKIKIHHGSIQYYRPQLISNKIKYKYVGVLHEYIDIQPNHTEDNLEGAYFHYNKFSGARSRSPSKYLEDAKILEKGLRKEPHNSRYMFYLAQSYRDAGNLQKAIEWYEKRAKAGGWIEEVFVSLNEIGKLKERLEASTYEIENAYLRAYYALPTRGESLYHLAKYFRCNNNFNKAYCYAKEALAIPKPTEALFLEHECYDWKALDEIAIVAYYVDRKLEGKEACEALMQMNLPSHDMDRIKHNYTFYC